MTSGKEFLNLRLDPLLQTFKVIELAKLLTNRFN